MFHNESPKRDIRYIYSTVRYLISMTNKMLQGGQIRKI